MEENMFNLQQTDKLDRYVITDEVLDDWLAQNVGLDLKNIPCSKPPTLSV